MDQQVIPGGQESAPISIAGPAPEGAWRTAAQYVRLGFEHIVPEGADHILFVLGLFLLATRLRGLLWQITAFTLAHCLSLSLSMYGIVSLPSRVVEPLIAASIAWIAIENIMSAKLHAWRPAIVFCFGLLHGLGFAGALRELGLPRGQFALGLASFNAGVELGQLAVIAAASGMIGWLRQRPWYRRWITIPLSGLIAAVGLYWAVQRTLRGA